jgi:hypothetical protein
MPSRGCVRHGKVLWVLLSGSFLVLGLGSCADQGGNSVASDPRVSREAGQGGEVPDLIGMDRDAASLELDRLGNSFTIDASSPPEDDLVYSQAPAPGTPLLDVDSVKLSVHCMPIPCPSPPPGRQIYDPCSCANR